jgi:hypothetical protein
MADMHAASTAVVVIDPNDEENIENGDVRTKDFRGESATEANCDYAYTQNEGWWRLLFALFLFLLGLFSNAVVQAIVADTARDMYVCRFVILFIFPHFSGPFFPI